VVGDALERSERASNLELMRLSLSGNGGEFAVRVDILEDVISRELQKSESKGKMMCTDEITL
jgi:hypothetical protein